MERDKWKIYTKQFLVEDCFRKIILFNIFFKLSAAVLCQD